MIGFECQKVQTKKSFDEIITLNFDLEHLEMIPTMLGVNFSKDYQKDAYTKNILTGKKLKLFEFDPKF